MNTIYLILGQHDKAIAEGKRAIALGPNDADAHVLLAQTMRYAGKFEESIVLSKKAMRLQPYYRSWYLINLGLAYYFIGNYEEAVALTKKYIQLDRSPGESELLWPLHNVLAMNYIRLGREDDARAHAAEVLRIFPSYSLELTRKQSFYKNPRHLEHHLDGLRKAGIPEHPGQTVTKKP